MREQPNLQMRIQANLVRFGHSIVHMLRLNRAPKMTADQKRAAQLDALRRDLYNQDGGLPYSDSDLSSSDNDEDVGYY